MKNTLLKSLSTLFIAIVLSSTAQAQTLPFTAKKSYITVGYGFPYNYCLNVKSAQTLLEAQNGSMTHSSLGPISINYEYAIKSTLGLGLDIAYTQAEYSANFSNGDISSYSAERLGISLRLAWHPYKRKGWDPYLAGMIGPNISLGDEYTNPELLERMEIAEPDEWLYGAKLGLRYFKPESAVGFFAEAGYTNTHFVQLGIAFRFGPDKETSVNVWDRRR